MVLAISQQFLYVLSILFGMMLKTGIFITNLMGKEKDDHKFLKKFEKYRNETNTSSILDFLHSFESSMKDMMDDQVVQKLDIGSCTFNNKLCNGSVFKRIYPLNDGYNVCYQFNGFDKEKLPRTISSRSKGLWITINLKTHLVKREQKPYHGVAVFIHPYEMPLKKGFASFVPTSTGTFNMLLVKTLQKRLLPLPYDSACDTKQYDFVKPDYPYTQAMCELDCMAKYLIIKSGCLGSEYLYYVGFFMFIPRRNLKKNIDSSFQEFISDSLQ